MTRTYLLVRVLVILAVLWLVLPPELEEEE